MRILFAVLIGTALAGGSSLAIVNVASAKPDTPIHSLYNYGSR
jgi:hypothetical protein